MMTFEIAAKQTFPELTSTITRKQAQEVCQLTGAKWPNHIINMSNSVGRGVFKFSADLEIEGVVAAPVVVESDSELDARIRTTYSNMELLTKSVGDGITTSMIISGAAGVGKSYTVKKILEANNQTTVHFIRGYVKATGIYKLLWENRQSHQTLVFDDCDSVFEDAVGLNLLKAALELSKSRRICWMSEKEFVDEDGGQIPNYFDYEGQIIFLTNIDFHELIAKGMRVVVLGRLQIEGYEKKDGTKAKRVEVLADEVAVSLRWGAGDPVARAAKVLHADVISDDEEPF